MRERYLTGGDHVARRRPRGAALALVLPQRVLAGLFGVLLVAMAVRMWPRSERAIRA